MFRDFKFVNSIKLEPEFDEFSSDLNMKKSLMSANYFLSTMAEKNKKYIKTLQNILAWITLSSQLMPSSLPSLMLTNSPSEENYDFELRLASEFNNYICKSKYINFIVEIQPLSSWSIPLHEKIGLEVKLYSSDQIPKQILYTMQGKPIIRGRGTEVMIFHPSEGKFLVRIKMQITEVSSHFINGNLTLVVSKKSDINYSIKPLMLKDLVVKAKEKTCKRWREQTR